MQHAIFMTNINHDEIETRKCEEARSCHIWLYCHIWLSHM